MVILNTINTVNSYTDLTVKYLLDVARLGLTFCSARDKQGKIHLFLIFNDKGRIYVRKGLNSTWSEVTDSGDYVQVRRLVNDALVNKRVPYFTNERLSLQGIVG